MRMLSQHLKKLHVFKPSITIISNIILGISLAFASLFTLCVPFFLLYYSFIGSLKYMDNPGTLAEHQLNQFLALLLLMPIITIMGFILGIKFQIKQHHKRALGVGIVLFIVVAYTYYLMTNIFL